jgi:hypothetical protein
MKFTYKQIEDSVKELGTREMIKLSDKLINELKIRLKKDIIIVTTNLSNKELKELEDVKRN